MLNSIRLYRQLQGKYLAPHWPLVLVLGVLLLAATSLQLITPQLVRHFIDVAVEKGALRSLYLGAIVFLSAGLTTQTLRAITVYLGRDIAWRATNRFRADLTLHVLRLDMGFHNANTPGELLERIDGDIERLANFFSQFFVQLVGATLLFVGLVIVTWMEDFRFGLAIAGFALFFLATRVRLLTFIIPFWKIEGDARSQLYGFLGERLSGITDIQKSGAVSFTMARFYEALRRRMFSWIKVIVIAQVAWGITSSVNSLRLSIGLAVGAYLFLRGDITIGTVYLIFNYLQMVHAPIHTLSQEFQDLQRAGASIQRIAELRDTSSKVQDGHGASLPSGKLSVSFRDVSFSYNPNVRVLQDISLNLEPGKTLGLLGRTGSGKTTMSRLLFRFYDPDEGIVRLGDVDLKDLLLKDLRNRVSLVTQEVQLFQASVRDNLTLFDPEIPDDRIVETIESLGLGHWFESLYEGLDTAVAAGGGQLSAGEAQLLAFARVFLVDPDCVLLDEASSRLDPATEALIQRAVDRLLADRTGIVIAHRLATVQRLDEIMIIDGGRVQEYGQRESLASDPDSRFAGLLKTGLEEVLV